LESLIQMQGKFPLPDLGNNAEREYDQLIIIIIIVIIITVIIIIITVVLYSTTSRLPNQKRSQPSLDQT